MPRQRMLEPAIEAMGRDGLRAEQERLLRIQIERCAASSVLYRAKLEWAGAEPGDVRTLEDLARLPVVTKEELREDQLAQPPFGTFAVADPASFREVHPSTGTTGTPVNTIWSEADVGAITKITTRTLWQFGVRPGDVIQNAFAYGLWVAGLSCHYAGSRLGCLVVPSGASVPTQRQIDFLQAVRSTVLLATPSYALHIAEALTERGIDAGGLSLSAASAARPGQRIRPPAPSWRPVSASTRSTTTASPRSGRPSPPSARPRPGSTSPRTTSSSSASTRRRGSRCRRARSACWSSHT
jgi:phenylacetate-CoA ligase